MYKNQAYYYDLIYHKKDYRTEANAIKEIIINSLGEGEYSLLDIACGTGGHINYLRHDFKVEGLDNSHEMLQLARTRFPDILFHFADMVDFNLDKQYNILTCLFSSIGYVRNFDNMAKAMSNFANHLDSGGLLIIEPWFTPDQWKDGTVHMATVDAPNIKIARINTSEVTGRISHFVLHHLVGSPDGVEYFTEKHEMCLFTREEMHYIFDKTGFDVVFDEKGLIGRGLYIGKKR